MGSSLSGEWKSKLYPIEFKDNIKGLPPLFEYLQAFITALQLNWLAYLFISIWE
jgi:hypothetical protein